MKIITALLILTTFTGVAFYLTNRISVLETKECLTWMNKDIYPDYPEKFSNWQRQQCTERGVLK